VYIEVDFHDVPAVAKWIIENVEDIGEAIAKGICNHFGVKYVEKPQPIKPVYRVQVGAFENKADADALAALLEGAFVVQA
jgi:N-acetylmuramoyl-L-alanine amidase